MILSADYAHGPTKPLHLHHHAPPSMLPRNVAVVHSPRHAVYAPYLVESPPWHHSVKQEPEEISTNNDSGVSPSHYTSDGSASGGGGVGGGTQSGSPRSEDSGQGVDPAPPPPAADAATLGVLARPILGSPDRRATPVTLRLSPEPQSQPLSPPQYPHTSPLPLPPRVSPLQHSILGFLPRHSPKPDESSRSPVSSPGEYTYEDPLRGLQMALHRRGMMGPLPVGSEPPVNGEKPLQCPLCQFSTTIRSAFNNHLIVEHSEQVSCHLCDHTAENHAKLRDHLKTEHDGQPAIEDEAGSWGDEEEQGVTTPKVNSQGKVKTYRCKQCEFSTVTKLEFWEHSRGHIKPERLLTCPKCPFVTEYKHHLEYHLRNHFGSKPFKCDKCSYSCVNKSMLNSHLKSHSNVYQFRCANCAYATKYCHSLKLHLRKYNHSPAMVLNPDGSPNPLPIVDVYGTRRGPKRPKKSEDTSLPQQPSLPSLHPMFSSPYNFLPSQSMPYPYNSFMNTFHRSQLLSFPNPPSAMQEEPPMSEPEGNLFSATMNTIQQSTINNNQEGVKEYLTRVISQQEIIARTEANQEEETPKAHGAPLDLSCQEPGPQEQIPLECPSEAPEQEQPEQLPFERPYEAPDPPADQLSITKNRRKGKAFKLERIAQRLHQSSDEDDGAPSPKQLRFDLSPEQLKELPVEPEVPVPVGKVKSPCMPKVSFSERGDFKSTLSEERKQRWCDIKEVYDCPYCDMLFGDEVMYTVHMGYHGYQSPFTCNMCGHQTSDRLQFFLHLFRYAHA